MYLSSNILMIFLTYEIYNVVPAIAPSIPLFPRDCDLTQDFHFLPRDPTVIRHLTNLLVPTYSQLTDKLQPESYLDSGFFQCSLEIAGPQLQGSSPSQPYRLGEFS